jgi:hypothetical protein
MSQAFRKDELFQTLGEITPKLGGARRAVREAPDRPRDLASAIFFP